ncbi:MAG: asparagine synthase-related protein [Actinomadura sp.]
MRAAAPITGWFAVVADGDTGADAARLLASRAVRSVAHGSGRPWLLGDWPAGAVTVAEAVTAVGTARLAVIGRCPVTAGELTARLRRLDGVEDADRVVEGLAGSFHLVVSLGGKVRVRGSASMVRQVFHARVAGTTVAADRGDVLAELIGAGLDEQVLAARLLTEEVPALQERCVWRDVTRVAADHCLILEADGRAYVRRWWRPPEPVLSLHEGADAVRQALGAAVDSCAAGGGTISADLSGGMDSTSLCLLASRSSARLVTLNWAALEAANDDGVWARRAARALPAGRQIFVDREQTPLWFAEVEGPHPVIDEPAGFVRDWARLRTAVRLMSAEGSRLHLIGGGGDELFGAYPAYLHDLFWLHPLTALARLRRLRVSRHIGPLWPQVRALVGRGSYRSWLARCARLQTPARCGDLAAEAFCLDWGPPLRPPPWATGQAVRAAGEVLSQILAEAEPLAPWRGQHSALLGARVGGAGLRQIDQATTAAGLPHAAPYLDDAVINAALSVRVDQRTGGNKPVLATAMRGIVPAHILTRPTIGDYGTDLYVGLHRHREELLKLFTDSILGGHGLIDEAALRAFVLRPHPRPSALAPLIRTLGCEVWLRTRAAGGSAPPLASRHSGAPT